MDFTGERYMPGAQGVSEEMGVEHVHRYQAVADAVRDRVVLDAACGEGYGSNILARFARQVHGIDLSAEAVAHAERSYRRANLSFQVASVAQLPFPDATFDVVVSFETIEHIDEETQQTFLREIRRVLKPDGVLVISTPDKHTYSEVRNETNHFHVHEFYPDEFRAFLSTQFPSVEFFFQRYVLTSLVSAAGDTQARLLSLQEKPTAPVGRYVIAVCANSKVELALSSLVDDALGLLGAKDQHIANLEGMLRKQTEALELARKELKLKDGHIANVELGSQTNLAALKATREQLSLKDAHIANIEPAGRANAEALARAREQLALTAAHIQNLEKSVQVNSTALALAREQLVLKDAHIANLEPAAQANADAVARAQEQLALKDAHIANLEPAAQANAEAHARAQEQLALQAAHIGNLEKSVAANLAALQTTQEQLGLKDGHIANLEHAIAGVTAAHAAALEQLKLKDIHILNLDARAAGQIERIRLQENHIQNLQRVVDVLTPAVQDLRRDAEVKERHIRNLEAMTGRVEALQELPARRKSK